MNDSQNIQDLLPGLKRGEDTAYRGLVRALGPRLLAYAQTITGDAAPDVVQDALLRVYRMRKRLDERQELRGLCFRIVRNLARNRVRDENLRQRREEESMQARNAHEKPQGREAWEQVARLPAELREVIELRFAHGLSREETALALELPAGTVATRQRTALERLRGQLASVGLVVALDDQLAQSLLAQPVSNLPSPALVQSLEETVMRSIQMVRLKTAGAVASAALLALLLVVSLSSVVASSLGDRGETTQPVVGSAMAGNENPHNKAGAPVRSKAAANEPAAEVIPAANAPEEPASTPAQPVGQPEKPATPVPEKPSEPVAQPPRHEKPDVPVTPKQEAPSFTSMPLEDAVADAEYLYEIKVTGIPAATLKAAPLPAWLKLNGAVLSGTPTRADMGRSAAVMLTASNGVAPDATQRFHILVAAAPQITSTPPKTAQAGVAYSYKIEVKGSPEAKLSVSGEPGWLSLKGSELSGTPAAKDCGITGLIKITASNGIKPDATQEFTIDVQGAPEFLSTPPLKVKAGEAYSYEVKVSGAPVPKLSARELPKWLKLQGNKLEGTPKLKDIGKDKVSLLASNGLKPDATQKFEIEVVSNDQYMELPWTVDGVKALFKVGFKWEMKSGQVSVAAGAAIYPIDKLEVIAVTDKGAKIKRSHPTYRATPQGAIAEYIDMESECTWEQLASGIWFYPGEGPRTVTSTKREKLTLCGKVYDCVVIEFETEWAGRKVPVRCGFIVDKPGIVGKCEAKYQTEYRLDWEFAGITEAKK